MTELRRDTGIPRRAYQDGDGQKDREDEAADHCDAHGTAAGHREYQAEDDGECKQHHPESNKRPSLFCAHSNDSIEARGMAP